MKNLKYIIGLLIIATTVLISCDDSENHEFGNVIAPTNVQVSASIVGQNIDDPNLLYGDGSGFVTFTVSATNAISFKIDFGDDKSEVVLNGEYTHRYTNQGVNKYVAIVSAVGTGGVISTETIEVEVYSAFTDPQAETFLSGANVGDSKTWYWAANLPTHVGLGPVYDDYGGGEFAWPAWWNSIGPWDQEKSCMYTNEFVFTKTANGVSFEQTVGPAFIPGTHAGTMGVAGDVCHDETVVPSMFGVKNLSFFPSSSKAALEGSWNGDPYRGTSFEISDDGFMGWFVGASTYDIIYVTEDELLVRIVEDGDDFAWYQLFTSNDPSNTGFQSEFNNLVWSDEFDVDGAPNAANWTYDLEDGCQIDPNLCGWGNGEEQWYTNDSKNVVVENGNLKITAIKESVGTREYSSARIKSKGLFEFTHGRVEIRAKLPASQGTWPAFWMLGANVDNVGWPASGEIDIMEHSANNPGQIHGTAYWENNGTASYGETTNVPTASSEFHVYTLEWRDDQLMILVDDTVYYTMNYDGTFPFNNDFFLLINLAMGGNFGGQIDANFTQDTLEVDYVRVYQ